MMTCRTILAATLATCLCAEVAAGAEQGKRAQAPAAAAILASAGGAVSVERKGAAPEPAAIGMRLQSGDVVVTGPAGSATIYFPGGSLRKLSGSARLEIKGEPSARAASPDARLSSDTMAVLEKGLWILNDPEGSILISAMRGDDPGWSAEEAETATPLSPRFETTAQARPMFRWSGGAKARVVVGGVADSVWKSPPGEPPPIIYPDSAPALDPNAKYWWRLEHPTTATAMSEKVPFRVPSQDLLARIGKFEAEIAALVNEDAVAADLMRSGFYLRTGSWTPMLAAAGRLRLVQARAEVAARAFEGACRQMRLTPDAAERLLDQLAATPASSTSR